LGGKREGNHPRERGKVRELLNGTSNDSIKKTKGGDKKEGLGSIAKLFPQVSQRWEGTMSTGPYGREETIGTWERYQPSREEGAETREGI